MTSAFKKCQAVLDEVQGAVEEALSGGVPGMPIEAYLKTTDRTVASYLLDPVTQTMRQAMRE